MPRPPLRAVLAAALLLACSGTAALAKPSFQTGPYLGHVAAETKPPLEFTATKKRVRRLEFGSLHVTCSDGRPGTVNLPGTPGQAVLQAEPREVRVRGQGLRRRPRSTRARG